MRLLEDQEPFNRFQSGHRHTAAVVLIWPINVQVQGEKQQLEEQEEIVLSLDSMICLLDQNAVTLEIV